MASFVTGIGPQERILLENLFPSEAELMGKIGRRESTLLGNLFSRSEVERRTALVIAEGAEAEQLRLYADFLHCSSPDLDSKSIRSCVAEARTRCGIITVQEVASNNAEANTYFSKQSLMNMLTVIEYRARSKEVSNDLKSTIELAAEYLDDMAALESHYNICGDPTELVLGNITNKSINELGLNAPAWERMQSLNQHEHLQGFIKNDEATVLFLGKSKPNAIEFDGFGWAVLSPQEGYARFKDYCAETIVTASTDKMRLYNTYPTPDGRVVEFPNAEPILISPAQEAALRAGTPLPPDHPLSHKLAGTENNVLFSNPYMEKESTALMDADSFAFALQKSYPKSKIIRDPLSATTSTNVDKVATFQVRSPADLLVVVSDPNLKVPQAKTIANIAADLSAANVNVTTFTGIEKYTGPTGKAVFVITGHSSEELATYVRQLGDAGYLKDNYVVFNSCGTQLTRQMVAEINGRFGAIGTFAFEGNIPAYSVQEYMLDLIKGLTGDFSFNLMEILNKAVGNHNMNGLFTVCMREDQP